MQLNPEQKKAIDTTDGPLLIIAGAGSGKTRVLTYRVYNLIKGKLAFPENILAVTFTNKAAREMKQRISLLLSDGKNDSISLPWVGTFHSICVRILRRHSDLIGFTNEFSIYDTADQLDSVKEALKKLSLTEKAIRPRTALSYISAAKNELIKSNDYAAFAIGYMQELISRIYPVYQQILYDNSAMDFDDLLMKTIEVFRQQSEVLDKYRELYRYVLVDEYQDTNHAQYVLANMLAKKHRNICVVGDDAQSIYSFRGATVHNILNFEKDYPEAKVIKLEQNYRSTKKILDAGNAVIAANKNQKAKILWTENEEGEQINLYEALDEKDEASYVAESINSLDNEDIAVLYRTNAQSRNLEEAFLNYGIPYQIVGSIEFYKRKEIKDTLAYMRILHNPNDDLSTKRIINVPRRGIGPATIIALEREAKATGSAILPYLFSLNEIELNKWGKKIADFTDIMRKLSKSAADQTVNLLIESVINISGYRKSLDDGTIEGENRLENIRELISVTRNYESMEPKASLRSFLEEQALIEDKLNTTNKQPRVKLMTIHSAKGLEFEYVFVVGMEEGIFPHSNSFVEPEGMEEERRLAYVAITRAKRKLFLTHTNSRLFFGSRNRNPLSRFVADIPEHLINNDSWEGSTNQSTSLGHSFREKELTYEDLAIGDNVEHQIFGRGVVKDIDESIILILFNSGTKELSREYAHLKKL